MFGSQSPLSVTRACFVLWWLALAGFWGAGDPAVLRWLILYAGLAMLLGYFTFRPFGSFDTIDWLTLALLLYAAESLLWSEDWRNGVWVLQNSAVAACAFAMVRRVPAVLDVVPDAAVAVLAMAVVLFWVYPVQMGGFGNENFLAEHILILIPLATGTRWRGLAVVISAVAVVALLATDSRLPYLAVAAALSAALVLRWPRWGSAALVVGAPLLIAVTWPAWVARIEIWFNASYAIREAPLFGHGLGGFQAAYDPFREKHFAVLGDYTITSVPSKLVADAHNEIVHLVMTLGLSGTALAAVLAWLILRNCKRNECASWALLIVAAFSMIEFPLHNPWTLVTAILAAARIAPHASGLHGLSSAGSATLDNACTGRRNSFRSST